MKVAMILSGSGVYDGSEIHEATMLMLSIVNNGMTYTAFAPNISQHHVINHLTGEEMKETRNVLIESARLVRGNISDLTEYDPSEFDALVIPGGFGAAKNLSNYAFKGKDMDVNADVTNAIRRTLELHKPIGFVCISPVIAAKVIGKNVHVTIGSDPTTAEDINSLGGQHIEKDITEVAVDQDNLIFSTPCYMSAHNIGEIYEGCNNMIRAMSVFMGD